MAKLPKVYVFLDTNYFLHWPGPDEINWCTLCNAEEVVLIVSASVIRELNDKKDGKNAGHLIQKRADQRLKYLLARVKGGANATIRDGVTITSVPHDPTTVDFGAHHLSKDLPDDWLLASIIEFRNEITSDQIRLATDDGGLQLKAPAHGIELVELPADKRLQDEPDEIEKENRKLREENAVLKNARPILSLTFDNDTKLLNARNSIPIPSKVIKEEQEYWDAVETEKRHRDEQLEQRKIYKQLGIPDLNQLMSHSSIGRSDSWSCTNPRYEEELSTYKEHFHRTYELWLKLSNEGTAPAQKVVLDLAFLEICDLSTELPDMPKLVLERFSQSFVMPKLKGVFRPLDVTIHGNLARWEIHSIKHNIPQSLGPMYVTTKTPGKPCIITFTIHCDNLAAPTKSALKVKFTKDQDEIS